MMNLIFIGAPGAGKGTQAKNLAAKFSLYHLSTGDMLRDIAKAQGPLAEKVRETIGTGALISDDLMVELVAEKVDAGDFKKGVIMDGFPRTLNQAKLFDSMLKLKGMVVDHVIYLSIPDEVLIDRITGRFTCGSCGEGYHDRYKSLKTEGVCDVCGSQSFVRRADDTREVLDTRLKNFWNATRELLDYYKAKGILEEVDGLGEIAEVQDRIENIWQPQGGVQSC